MENLKLAVNHFVIELTRRRDNLGHTGIDISYVIAELKQRLHDCKDNTNRCYIIGSCEEHLPHCTHMLPRTTIETK